MATDPVCGMSSTRGLQKRLNSTLAIMPAKLSISVRRIARTSSKRLPNNTHASLLERQPFNLFPNSRLIRSRLPAPISILPCSIVEREYR